MTTTRHAQIFEENKRLWDLWSYNARKPEDLVLSSNLNSRDQVSDGSAPTQLSQAGTNSDSRESCKASSLPHLMDA